MSATLVIVILLLILGERAGDALERRQHEVVLSKLPLPEAHAHYERLRRRSRRIRILRALTLASLVTMAYVYRHTIHRTPTVPAAGAGGHTAFIRSGARASSSNNVKGASLMASGAACGPWRSSAMVAASGATGRLSTNRPTVRCGRNGANLISRVPGT